MTMPRPGIDATICLPSGAQLCLQVPRNSSILNLKQVLKRCHGYRISSMTLLHNGVELSDAWVLQTGAITPAWYVLEDIAPLSLQPLTLELTLIVSADFCAHCWMTGPAMKMKLCGRCQRTWYCSRECQTLDWSRHRESCHSCVQRRPS